MSKFAAVVVLGLAFSSVAQAGPYVGAGVASSSPGGSGFVVLGGYAGPRAGVEIGFVDFGAAAVPVGAPYQVEQLEGSWYVAPVLRLPVSGPWSVFGQVGLHRWSLHRWGKYAEESDSGVDPMVGAGAQVQVGGVSVRAGVQRFVAAGNAGDIDLVSVSASVPLDP